MLGVVLKSNDESWKPSGIILYILWVHNLFLFDYTLTLLCCIPTCDGSRAIYYAIRKLIPHSSLKTSSGTLIFLQIITSQAPEVSYGKCPVTSL